MNKYFVCQFFEDGSCEHVKQFVKADEAVQIAISLTTSVGANKGTTRRVTITDRDYNIYWGWEYEKGTTFPPELVKKGRDSIAIDLYKLLVKKENEKHTNP